MSVSGSSVPDMDQPAPDDFTDLRGRSLERLDLTGADIRRVRLGDARLRRVVMTDGVLRGGHVSRSRLLGVELIDVEITGEVENVTINGVEVGAYVNAQLDLRDPERAMLRATTPEELRQAWAMLERRWADTVARAQTLDPALLHVNVDEEWSFIQTLRHLVFATDAWLHRAILGDPAPWHDLGLPWDEAPGWEGVPWDRDAQPDLEDVLALRREQTTAVRDYLATLTPEQLTATVTPPDTPGFPPPEPFPVAECLKVILIEEWEHRSYAERDLDRVLAQSAAGGPSR